MGRFIKIALALAAPLIASGCVWSPGKFGSQLAVRKDGTFTLDYKGEILFMMPDGPKQEAAPWSADLALCFADGKAILADDYKPVETDATESSTEGSSKPEAEERPCTAAELARLKGDYDRKNAERAASKQKEADQMAAVFGLPSNDDVSARKFAASVMKYKGWRSVTYKGKGVYDVDYHLDGRLDQDFLWPAMPDADMIVPFIAIRRRSDGAVLVTAPAFAGGEGPFGARAKMLGMPDKGGPGEKMRAEGRFTIVTNGEILTNNSEDGPKADKAGRALTWEVSPSSSKTPEALIRP